MKGTIALVADGVRRQQGALRYAAAQGVPLELHEGAALGQLERVKQLVEKEPSQAESYSPDGFPVIALTTVFGHLEVAEYLFAKGADVNAVATNGTGYNALTGAVAADTPPLWRGSWKMAPTRITATERATRPFLPPPRMATWGL